MSNGDFMFFSKFLFVVFILFCFYTSCVSADASNNSGFAVCGIENAIDNKVGGSDLLSSLVKVKGARYLKSISNNLEDNEKYSHFYNKVAGRREQVYIFDGAGYLYALNPLTSDNVFIYDTNFIIGEIKNNPDEGVLYKEPVEPVVADIYDGLEWRTILVLTSSSGKGIFVFDITDPDAVTLLWKVKGETDATHTSDFKLGNSIGRPTVARLHNGEWAIVVGNGYGALDSESGAAALYMFNAVNGTLISTLEVHSGLGEPNGLSSPRLADYDGDGIADYAYAGDLHGNLWRFDLLGDGATPPSVSLGNGYYGANSGTTNRFQVSYGGQPMFVAKASGSNTRQPIVAAPSLVRHPTGKGHLVIFGTGLNVSMVEGIAEQQYTHSLYGIWDLQTAAEATKSNNISYDQLTLQSIAKKTTGIEGSDERQREARVISNNPVEWYTNFDSTQVVNRRGWYLDFQVKGISGGEMLVDDMRTLGSMLLLQTLTPKNDPCNNSFITWLYAINPQTGGRTAHQAFGLHDIEHDGVTGIKFGQPGPIVLLHNEQGFKVEAADESVAIIPPPQSWGRQSWRMLSDP